jgi:hypothetical protein
MIPREGNQGTESESKQHNTGEIFQNLLGDSLCKEFRDDVTIVDFAQKSTLRRDVP